MTYPVLNIPYKDVYSSCIEFQTQINKKQKGREQRYPVKTYPKRTFKLSFDKTSVGRNDIENFFNTLRGTAGMFEFTWSRDKGGNGKTYLCHLESDEFKQKIKEYGFSEFELTFACIDNSAVVDSPVLDFWHSAECSFSTWFETFKDSVLTANYAARTYQDVPKRKWRLNFNKTDEVRKAFEQFFIAKRGKFRAFRWVWDSSGGGDGNTYTVRFDTDILSVDINEYGISEFSVDIVEVFETPNPLSEVEKDEIIPRKLLKLDISGGPVYILDNETIENLHYNGETYIGAPLSHDKITKDDNSAVNKLKITLSNVGLTFSGIIGNRGDVVTDAPALLTLVFLNLNTDEIIPEYTQLLYSGHCNNLQLDCEKASVTIETELGGYEKLAPVMKYRSVCQVRRFKDCRCGYLGIESSCDRTFSRCLELMNTQNFAGYPQMYNELVIKA